MQVNDFSLKNTLESGQFFRYSKTENWYQCSEGENTFLVKQDNNNLEFKGISNKKLAQFLGLNCNYAKIIKELSNDYKLLPALEKCHGLRIMQREPWETLVSFQCSIFSNVKKIMLNMKLLAEEFGRKNKRTYTFPKPGEINDLKKIKKCATGFRAKYIHNANKLVSKEYFEKLKKKNYSEAKTELMKLPGVGEKVADCVCLFSLGKMEAFPVDVWIKRMIE